jgi:hypothetical protein
MWYVDDYNTGMARQFARIRDFIILHACLTASCGAPWRPWSRPTPWPSSCTLGAVVAAMPSHETYLRRMVAHRAGIVTAAPRADGRDAGLAHRSRVSSMPH